MNPSSLEKCKLLNKFLTHISQSNSSVSMVNCYCYIHYFQDMTTALDFNGFELNGSRIEVIEDSEATQRSRSRSRSPRSRSADNHDDSIIEEAGMGIITDGNYETKGSDF